MINNYSNQIRFKLSVLTKNALRYSWGVEAPLTEQTCVEGCRSRLEVHTNGTTQRAGVSATSLRAVVVSIEVQLPGVASIYRCGKIVKFQHKYIQKISVQDERDTQLILLTFSFFQVFDSGGFKVTEIYPCYKRVKSTHSL